MQAVHVFARTSSQAEMVQANPALQEAVAVMCRTGWLDADSCPSAYAIEQLVSIADWCHAQSGQEPAVESPRRRKLTHGQYEMRHAVAPIVVSVVVMGTSVCLALSLPAEHAVGCRQHPLIRASCTLVCQANAIDR